MKRKFLISSGRAEDAKEFQAGFASDIIDQCANKTAETELEAQDKVMVLSSNLGQHTYTIWKLVPIKTIHRMSKPIEFETKIEVLTE